MSVETENLELLAVAGLKPRLRITATSCRCGGNWAWVLQRATGAWVMLGCVCHHWWTLALRQ